MLSNTSPIASVVFLVSFLVACGGGGGGGDSSGGNGGTVNVAPAISNLELSHNFALFNEGGGRTSVQAMFDYTDPEGDIVTVRIEISDGSSLSVEVEAPIPAPSGTLAGDVEFSTTQSGVFTAEVWVVDAAGNSSNRLSVEFTIYGSAELTDLSLVEAAFSQPFEPDEPDYFAKVASDVAQVFVTAVLLDPNSTFDVNGVAGASGAQTGPFDVDFGMNELVVSIAATYGDDTREYRIRVERELSSNARLSSLSVTPGILDQAFDPDVENYTATLSFLARFVYVIAETEDENATVEVNGMPVPSGVPSDAIPVFKEDASTQIDISVIAQDSLGRIRHRIQATRKNPPPFASFEIIADDTTQWPGSADLLNWFREPAYDGTTVTFWGARTGEGGIFVARNGNLEIIADTSTPEPRSGVDTFEVFGDPAIDGNGVAFHSYAPNFGGIYTSIGGNLAFVADNQTPIPNGSDNFSNFSTPAFDEGVTAFTGFGWNQQRGIYANLGGALDMVVDKTTVAPNASGAFFDDFGAPNLVSSSIVFRGRTPSPGQEGIYRIVDGNLEVIADRTTLLPGGSAETLQYFEDQVDQDSDRIAFVARDNTFKGNLLVHDGISLQLITDSDTPEPMRSAADVGPNAPVALDGSALLFHGMSGPVLVRDDTMATIAGAGDVIGGRVIEWAYFRHDALADNKVALLLRNADLSRSVALADFSIETPFATAAYELENSFADEQGGPDLVPLGGVLQGKGYAFGQNQGLSSSGVLAPNEYSIELVFRLDNVDSLRKVIDFAELASDSGLYLDDGIAKFVDAASQSTVAGNGPAAEVGIHIHVVMTRDAASGTVTVFIDGEERLRFVDAAAEATFATAVANFFRDDDATQTDATAGFVHFLRIYDSALSTAQVRFLSRSLSDCALDGCLER
jgi:hypothetical protein